MGTNCAPLITDLFLICYERDFMSNLHKSKQYDLIVLFIRFMADLLRKYRGSVVIMVGRGGTNLLHRGPLFCTYFAWLCQARIQEFSSGGSNLLKNFDKQKKNKIKNTNKGERGRGEGGRLQYLFCFSMVEIYFWHWNSFTDNNFFYKYDIARCFLQAKHIRGDCLSFVKWVSNITGWGSGGPPPPPKKNGLNGLKSCNFRQYKHRNGTFMKTRDSVYDGRRVNPLNVEVIRIFQIFILYVWYWRAERARKKLSK